MLIRFVLLLAIVNLALPLTAQSGESIPFEIYGGFSYLSNSFNGEPGARQGLTGWDVSAALPASHGLRFKVDIARYSGTNLGAAQQGLSILGGAQYEHMLHRERVWAEALFGDVGMNRNWGPNGALGGTASFETKLGGGLDTPVSRHFAIRVQGDYQHTNLALIESRSDPVPFHVAGLPNNFGSFSTGVVWMPRVRAAETRAIGAIQGQKEPVESEWMIEYLQSFGHYHVFAYTWWSYLSLAGVEYDRHSWGRFIGARRDYVAEVLPVVILRQPSKTDVFGDPLTTAHKDVEGVGISPIGMRLIWRDGKVWKPYYTIKGGMVGFNKKALSEYASYVDFSLQQSIGLQFRVTDRWGVRAGLSDFHFSNGFIVPNNPGIDEMSYNFALCYRVGTGRDRR
jgi:hypothetical protein